VINMSVRWWRTLHPQPIVFRALDPALPGEMLLVLAIGVVAVTLLALWLIVLATETETLTERVYGLRARLDRSEE